MSFVSLCVYRSKYDDDDDDHDDRGGDDDNDNDDELLYYLMSVTLSRTVHVSNFTTCCELLCL